MDKINSYIDFKVIINVPYKGKTNSFLGLINKKLYEYEHLLSKCWKDSPSFFNGMFGIQIIKIDDNEIQVGIYYIDYGCYYEKCETIFGIR